MRCARCQEQRVGLWKHKTRFPYKPEIPGPIGMHIFCRKASWRSTDGLNLPDKDLEKVKLGGKGDIISSTVPLRIKLQILSWKLKLWGFSNEKLHLDLKYCTCRSLPFLFPTCVNNSVHLQWTQKNLPQEELRCIPLPQSYPLQWCYGHLRQKGWGIIRDSSSAEEAWGLEIH